MTFHKKGRGGFQDFRAAIPFLETFPIGSMVLVYIYIYANMTGVY